MSLSAETSSTASPSAAPSAIAGATSHSGSAAARAGQRVAQLGDRLEGEDRPAPARLAQAHGVLAAIGADVDHGVDALALERRQPSCAQRLGAASSLLGEPEHLQGLVDAAQGVAAEAGQELGRSSPSASRRARRAGPPGAAPWSGSAAVRRR